MFGSMTVLLTLINWDRIILQSDLLRCSPIFVLLSISTYLVWYLIFMRLKPVSRDRSCLNRSVRICNDENLLPGSWPPPNFLELRKSLKVHTQTSARIPPPGATLCIFHMFNVGCHSIRWGMTIDETGPGSARVCLDHGALPSPNSWDL